MTQTPEGSTCLLYLRQCDTAPVVSSLMQVISRPVHTGGGGGVPHRCVIRKSSV